MPSPVLLSVLVSDVRTHLGWELPDMTATDAEIKRLVGQAAKRLYARLIQARGADYYLTTGSQVTTATTNGIFSLPTDFWRLQDLRITVPGGLYSLTKFDRHSVASLKSMGVNGTMANRPYMYALRGNQKQINTGTPANLLLYTDAVEILPIPPAGLTLEYDYVPTAYQVLSAAATDQGEVTFDGVAGFEEWIVCDVCATLVAKEEGDPGFWMARKREVDDLVQSCAGARDEGRPQQVQDVNSPPFAPGRRYQ